MSDDGERRRADASATISDRADTRQSAFNSSISPELRKISSMI
jgi:hypothetical protein